VGGLAVAGYAAYGGATIAWQYSIGRLSIAHHANVAAAHDFMHTSLMRAGQLLVTLPPWSRWLITPLFVLPMVIAHCFVNRRPTK
jgi:hypothetical protein